MLKRFLSGGLAILSMLPIQTAESALPDGILLWHSYSDYTAMDSALYQYDTNTNERLTISDGSFVHAMNGDFGSHGYDITFMAIDPAADEWDIYRLNGISGRIENLTPNSGFRNEDPKFSPCGNKIVFKRGAWSHETDGFVYDLAELDLKTGTITMLTNDADEESMPVYAADGCILYSGMTPDGTGIFRLDPSSGKKECLFLEENVTAYYPMTQGEHIYFTKWISPDNPKDCVAELVNGKAIMLPFCQERYNTSDVFPLQNDTFFYSSTKNGGYDLMYYDGTDEICIDLLNSSGQELGASFYSQEEAESIVVSTADYLLHSGHASVNMDADGNGTVNGFDLAFLKKLTHSGT